VAAGGAGFRPQDRDAVKDDGDEDDDFHASPSA
jgi:hypothetical protein